MGLRIRIQNPNLNSEERTSISADYTSGVTVTVRNNNAFTATNYAVAGEPGQEQTEQALIASISGNTTITLTSGFNFAHPNATPMYESRFNKVSVERAPTGTTTWAEITNSPFTLEWDNVDKYGKITTLIEDTSGSTAYDYRWRFLNAQTSTYSSYSGTLPGTGLDRSTAGFVINKIRRNPITQGIEDEILFYYMNDLQDMVYEEMPKAWWGSKEGTAVATEDGVYRYSIDDNWPDFLSMQYLLYNYVSGSTDNTYPLTFKTQLEFWDLKVDANKPESDSVTKWSLLPPDSDSEKGYIGIDPTPATDDTCYLKPVYFIELTDINSFEDTLLIPKPKIYEDYIFYRIYDDIKNDAANADKFNARVGQGIVALKKRTRRQQGQREWRRFRGQRGYSKMFGGSRGMTTDELRENYW